MQASTQPIALERATYQQIEDYGMIGNMRTVALVSIDGSVDWFCPQQFDAPSVFAAILDRRKGGFFQIRPQIDPETDVTHKQFYWPDTNVLITRFLHESGVVEITDYMPVGIPEEQMQERWLMRKVKMVRGAMPLQMVCRPAFNYARDAHTVNITENGACFYADKLNLMLATTCPLTQQDDAVVADIHLQEGDIYVFTLGFTESDGQ